MRTIGEHNSSVLGAEVHEQAHSHSDEAVMDVGQFAVAAGHVAHGGDGEDFPKVSRRADIEAVGGVVWGSNFAISVD